MSTCLWIASQPPVDRSAHVSWPEAEGKLVIVANCQAGWQVMTMAAIRPDLVGPILLAGSPPRPSKT
jgi:hypothetical protein